MRSGHVKNLKENLLQIKFGILKTGGIPPFRYSNSLMIETHKVTDEGYIWCTAPYSLPSELFMKASFGVKLHYVQKATGLFIKVTGKAKVINPSFNTKYFEKNESSGVNEKVLLLKVKIERVHYYKKKSLSPYTSILQAVNNFTLAILPGKDREGWLDITKKFS